MSKKVNTVSVRLTPMPSGLEVKLIGRGVNGRRTLARVVVDENSPLTRHEQIEAVVRKTYDELGLPTGVNA